MADEVKITLRMVVANPDVTRMDIKPPEFSADWPTAEMQLTSVTTSTTAAALDTATGIATFGWCYFFNTDLTDSIEIGTKPGATFFPSVTLQPREYAFFRSAVDVGEIFAEASANTPILEWLVLADS